MVLYVHQPQYLPWPGYFDKIQRSDCFVFLDKVQYKPREYQNRNKIRTKDGWLWLTVPVVSKDLGRQETGKVRIDNSFAWQSRHWQSLKACYGKARFFKDYSDFFEEIYTKKQWEKLIDLNIYITTYLLKEFSIDVPLRYESEIGTSCSGTDRIIEICGKLKADIYLSGAGGKAYLEEEKFNRAGVKLIYQDFVYPVYRQRFMSGKGDFISHLSIVDLLFNEGPAGMARKP